MNEVKKKQLNPTVLWLIGILIAAVCLWSAKYVLITALVLPFLGAYLIARLTPTQSVLYHVAAGVLCYLFFGKYWLLAFFMILVSGLFTALAVKKKLPTYEAMLLSCAGWFCAFLIVIAYCYLHFGSDPLTMIVETIRQAVTENDAVALFSYIILRSTEVQSAATTEAAMLIWNDIVTIVSSADIQTIRDYVLSDGSMAIINNAAALMVPSTCTQIALLGGLFSYLSTRALVKRGGAEVVPIVKMRDFKVPVKMTTPLALLYIASFLAIYFFSLPSSLQIVCYLLMNSLATIFAVQGVTLIHWLITLRSKNKATTIALSIVIPLVCMILSVDVLSWVGFFEMLFKLRYKVIVRRANPDNKV